jgi:hypothetical protein
MRMEKAMRKLILIFLFLAAQVHAEKIVYMDDVEVEGTGISLESPLNNLRSFQLKVRELLIAAPGQDIILKIAPGSYVGESQFVTWTETEIDPNIQIVIEALDPNDPPIFDNLGSNSGLRLFTLNYTKGPSNITLRGLHLKNWVNGVGFAGQRESDSLTNSNNKVLNCIFENIGNKYFSPKIPISCSATKPCSTGLSCLEGICRPTGFSAISLVNSDNNTISWNKFINVENIGSGVHGIYAAHNSQNNSITHNIFDVSNGSMVKLRDSSDNNLIYANDFKNSTSDAVPSTEHWYCERAVRSDCTKTDLVGQPVGECPSSNNRFELNSYGNVTDFFVNSQVYQSSNTGCSRTIPAPQYTLTNNFDTARGVCELKSIQGCPTFGFQANEWFIDHASIGVTTSQSLCAARTKSYYASCTAAGRGGAIQDAFTSRLTVPSVVVGQTSAPYFNGKYGNGCTVVVQNCPRMGSVISGVEAMDRPDDTGIGGVQVSQTACLNRVNDWYSSCSRDDNEYRLVRSRFYVNGANVDSYSDKVKGHGCVVKATLCPRKGFEANGYQLDALGHSSSSQCLARASTWWTVCTANLSAADAAKVTINSTYYSNGASTGSRTYSGP